MPAVIETAPSVPKPAQGSPVAASTTTSRASSVPSTMRVAHLPSLSAGVVYQATPRQAAV